MTETSALDLAIAALDAQRQALGDAAVEAAIAALRRHAPPPVATPDPPSPLARPRLRQVSVLFVDIAESTRLVARVGAEESADLLGHALRGFADEVVHRGGRVLRFTGDGLKAVFGADAMREDEAVHAVQAGLDILRVADEQSALLQAQRADTHFGVRVGIHTGDVLMGGGAEAERGAIGHAVHLAARMEQSAPVGRLRISHDTWSQVRGLFRVQAQPPLNVKGHDAPLLTYLVLGAEADPERAAQRGVEGLATPMIGRDAELQHLLDQHAGACRDRALRAVTVLGDAGTGKTRLRRELLERLRIGRDGAGLLQARAHPDSHLQPYGMLRQLLARWLRIADDLDLEAARARLVAGLAPWIGRRGQERAEIVGHLVGLDFGASAAVRMLGPQDLREQAFTALADAMHALALVTPLLLVLDDLHWADDASLDFLAHVGQAGPAPMLLLMLARPPLRERRAVPLSAEGVPHETLLLQPLDAEQGPALADALLRPLTDPPEALRRLLVQRAEGNPFYMEELLRMLIDDGVIDARAVPWSLQAGWADRARIPSTLVGVLQARLHALPADELEALQKASIVGPVVWDAALAAIDARAPTALPALERRSLLLVRLTSAFAGAAEYAFHHHLLHEVTYDTVLKRARQEGHARAARWMAERIGDRGGEFLGITAAHFERAGDADNARDYYDRARADAARRSAHSAALDYGNRALRQPGPIAPMWRYQLLMDQQIQFEKMDRLDEALAMQKEANAHAEACDSDAMRADVATTGMLAADREGRAGEAQRLARLAVALAEPAGAAAPAALAHGELAWLALMRGEPALASQHIVAGRPWARLAAGKPWREGGYVGYEHQLRVIEIEILLPQRRWTDARAVLLDGLATLPPDRRRERLAMLLQLSRVETHLGRLQEASATCATAAAQAEALDIVRLQGDVNNAFADIAHLRGDVAALERYASEAERLSRVASNTVSLATAAKHHGHVAAARGDIAAARARWREALRRYEEQGIVAEALQVRAELAELERHEGRPDAAVDAVLALLEAGRGLAAEGPAGAMASAANATDAKDPWPRLEPASLLRCHAILTDARPAQADAVLHELRRRLDEQLAQLADGEAREQLKQALPHWRETVARLARAHDGAGATSRGAA